MDTRNGLNLELEELAQLGSEYVFGASSPEPLINVPVSLREKYLPAGELQRGSRTDTMDCATRGPLNKLETDFNYAIKNKIFSDALVSWLVEKGYVDPITFTVSFSDRFIAILSGTTREGNSMKAPIHAIHQYGLIPKKLLPFVPDMSWDEYYDASKITQEMRDLGAIFAQKFVINYEKVYPENRKDLNEKEMLVDALHAWTRPDSKGIYPRTEEGQNHVILTIHPEYFVFDNYLDRGVDGDFIKQIAPDYKVYDYSYRIFVSGINENVPEWKFSVTILSKIIEILKELLSVKKKQELEYVPPVVPVVPKVVEQEAEKPFIHEITKAEVLYKTALNFLGRDASPKNKARRDVACAETVSNLILESGIAPDFPYVLGTADLKYRLDKSPCFKRTLDIRPGFVVVFATGEGNGRIRGHALIMGENNVMLSNNSDNGLLDDKWTLEKAVKYWRTYGGMKMCVWEPI